MAHIIVPEAEKLLDQEIKVLDQGFVRLVDYMGGDDRIVQTARVSYGAGTKTVREDAALIDYLMRHQHTSPFEHVVFEFHCKLPIFVARQWIRHRMARLNEISGRYSVMSEEFYVPPANQIRLQSQDNKQGRDTAEVPAELQAKVLELLRRDQGTAYATYSELIGDRIARELARINLPLSLYTQWYWQMDLHNLLHFLALRLDPHAQWEIRQYAEVLAKIVKATCPMAYASFERHVLRGRRFSADEMEALRRLLAGEENPLSGRRRQEFEDKLFGRDRVRPSGPAAARAHVAPPAPEKRADERAAAAASAAPARTHAGGAAPDNAEPELVSGWPVTLSVEQINALPLRQFTGDIRVVRDEETLASALKELEGENVLGFDTESRPSFQRGQNFPVSVVQLSTADCALVIQLGGLKRVDRLFRLLADPKVLKVGIALDQDLVKLRHIHPFEPAGFVDVGRLATRHGFKKSGLRGLAAIMMGVRVSKGAQRSNWAREQLTQAQIAYAATDAWISRELYLAMRAKGLTDEKAPRAEKKK